MLIYLGFWKYHMVVKTERSNWEVYLAALLKEKALSFIQGYQVMIAMAIRF